MGTPVRWTFARVEAYAATLNVVVERYTSPRQYHSYRKDDHSVTGVSETIDELLADVQDFGSRPAALPAPTAQVRVMAAHRLA